MARRTVGQRVAGIGTVGRVMVLDVAPMRIVDHGEQAVSLQSPEAFPIHYNPHRSRCHANRSGDGCSISFVGNSIFCPTRDARL